MTNGPVEPSADLRELANMLRQTYVALTLEGFTAQEALIIIGQILAANSGGQS
jgi:hypothetical protein